MSETSAPDDEYSVDLEEAMRDVVDPELGINVVDLGLVYGVNLEEARGNRRADRHDVDSAACPLTDVIEDQSRSALVGAGLVNESGSTGCGIRRGARTRSPRTAASSCAPWASPSDL